MANSVFEFGEFRLDIGQCELLSHGHSVRLERKPLELLILLATSNGRLVSRDEIAGRLWEDGVFVDTEHGINTAIRKIRASLHDNPDNPRFIQTVSGRGYRFLAPVSTAETASPTPPEAPFLPSASSPVQVITPGIASNDPAIGLLAPANPGSARGNLRLEMGQPDALELRAQTSPAPNHRLIEEALEPPFVSEEVSEAGKASEQRRAGFIGSAAASRMSRRTFLWAAGAAAAIWGGTWFVGRKRPLPPAMSVAVPLVDGTTAADVGQLLGAPVIAPDGSAIIVSLSTSNGAYLFRRPLNSNHMSRIEGSQYASLPFWSPDSQHIGFFADGQLKRMPAFGGSSVVLCAVIEPRGGCWNDDTILFAPNLRGIFRIAATGGTATQVTTLDAGTGENSHRFPLFLPDGNRFLYFSRSSSLDNRGIYLESLDRKQSRRRVLVADGQFALGTDPNSGAHFLITQQAGKLVAQEFDCDHAEAFGSEHILLDHAGQVSTSNTGALALRTEAQVRSTLVWRDREGRRLGSIGKPDDYWQAAISPNDRFVAIVRHDALTGVFRAWTASLPNGQMEVLSDADHVDSITWSHDGGTLYYIDYVQRKLFRRRVDPRGPEELVQSIAPGDKICGVSPDDQIMVVERSQDGIHSSSEWSELHPLQWHVITPNGFLGNTSLSPDGRSLAFGSNTSGRMEIYLAEFPGVHNLRRVSPNGGSCPRWRHDGQELFYIADDDSLMSLEFSSSARNRGVSPKALFRTSMTNATRNTPYDVGSDGSRFLLLERDSSVSGSSVELLLNWPSLISG